MKDSMCLQLSMQNNNFANCNQMQQDKAQNIYFISVS